MNGPSRGTRVALAVLVLTALVLVVVDSRTGSGSPFTALRAGAGTVFGPLERAVAAGVNPIAGVVGRLDGGGGDTRALQQEIDRLRAENDRLRAQAERGDELDRLLGIARAGQYRTVPAQVIGLGGAFGFEYTVQIDAGSRDGVRPDLTVINDRGLVGRVVSVTPFTAQVLLAIDPGSQVGVRAEASSQIGVVSGAGRDPLGLQMLTSDGSRVAPGTRLVTVGTLQNAQSPFVPEVPVGVVRTVASGPGPLSGTVTPYVDFGALRLVGVVVEAPRSIPRDSVLPTPAPTSPAPASPTGQTAPVAPGAPPMLRAQP